MRAAGAASAVPVTTTTAAPGARPRTSGPVGPRSPGRTVVPSRASPVVIAGPLDAARVAFGPSATPYGRRTNPREVARRLTILDASKDRGFFIQGKRNNDRHCETQKLIRFLRPKKSIIGFFVRTRF